MTATDILARDNCIPTPESLAFREADRAWQRALDAAFPRDANQARYEARGRGEPGSPLRAAYEARMAAYDAWCAVIA